MSATGIIRLEPTGPDTSGLTPLDLDPADFQSSLPEQNWHVYHEDSAAGLTVGVWTTTSMQEAFGPYPGDEFMHILEGQVRLLDDQGNEEVVNEGQTFIVKNGVPVSWKQDGFCRKFFLIHMRPDAPVPDIRSAKDGIKIFSEADLTAKFRPMKSESGVQQRDAEVFVNDTGDLSAGMWETDPLDTPMEPFPFHEFAQMLSGHVAITENDGTVHEFGPGDCFFIPAGTICAWKSKEAFRKYYCTITPKQTA